MKTSVKPDSDDMGTGIARTLFGYGCLLMGMAIGVIVLIAAFCEL